SILAFQRSHPLYTNTPLYSLKQLANHLNLQYLKVKDESKRFGLNAFKVMGSIYAISNYLAKLIGEDLKDLSFAMLQSSTVKQKTGKVTFISATDGNHGRAVAWAARELGHKAVIYMPKGSSKKRLAAIQNEGAIAYMTNVNHDETVKMCDDLAKEKKWVMVQDTAWEGYEEIPLWIMQGYAGIAKEITEQLNLENAKHPTHIFLQIGVGYFAASITSFFLDIYYKNPSIIVLVEPNQADCYYTSFLNENSERTTISGELDSIMSGLCCSEPSTRAFNTLRNEAQAAFSCADEVAALGMRIFANPLRGDPRIISGESGAVTLGLVYYIQKLLSNKTRQALKIDNNSRLLLINTEGNTDAKDYFNIVWKGAYANFKSNNTLTH